jgi:hypothetical protein
LTTVIHVKPAVIHVDIMSDPPPIKHKTEDPTKETLTKASYYIYYSQKAQDPFNESFLLQCPRSSKATASLLCLIKQAFNLQG